MEDSVSFGWWWTFQPHCFFVVVVVVFYLSFPMSTPFGKEVICYDLTRVEVETPQFAFVDMGRGRATIVFVVVTFHYSGVIIVYSFLSWYALHFLVLG